MPDTDKTKIYEFGGFQLIPEQRQLTAADRTPVVMRGKVFELLSFLLQHRGRLVEKTELMEALWPNSIVEENNLNQTVSSLRQALGETAQSPKFIATISGRGYQFVGEVKIIDDSTPRVAATAESPSPGSRHLIAAGIAVVVAVVLALLLLTGNDRPASNALVLEKFSELTPKLTTDFHGSHSAPTLSPDGSMMAWISDVSGTPQVWVKNLQSGDPIQITDGEFAASSPAWSPDNDRILYARAGPTGPAIFSVGTLGTPEPRMIIEHGNFPSFGLNTDTFLYTIGLQIWIATGDGRDFRRIEGVPVGPGFSLRMPALSPDGSKIAFIHADGGPVGNLWIMSSSGSEARKLTSFEISDGAAVDSPAWSSDGRFIVYTVHSLGAGSQLWRMSIETGVAQALTTGPGGANQAVMSADGRRLAYTNVRTSWRLTRLDPASGERSTIFESRHAILLPYARRDGRKIVFFSPLSSGTQVFTIGSDGGDFKQETFDDSGSNALPIWSDDGASIYYYRDRDFHRLLLDEGRDEKVIEDFHWSSRNWVAVHGDELAYHEFDRASGFQRAVIRDMVTGVEVELPVKLSGAEWSVDGSEILGFVFPPGELTICQRDSLQCEPITYDGVPVSGQRPRWSRDEQSIYYLRFSDKGECCTLWVVERDGDSNTELFDLNDYDPSNSYFGIDERGMVFYSHMDNSTSEIWLSVAE